MAHWNFRQRCRALVLLATAMLVACAPAAPSPTAAPQAPQPGAAAKPAQEPAAKQPPSTVEQLAKYSGPDRQKILEEGAKKEGKITWYASTIKATLGDPIMDAFIKKYPFLAVDYFRADPEDLGRRLVQEFKAGHYSADVVEQSLPNVAELVEADVFEPYSSPSADKIPGDAKLPADCRVCTYVQTWQLYPTIAFNTNAISKNDAPKSWDDLLNPKWKGKMSITPSGAAIDWVGMILQSRGEDYMKKLSAQEVRVLGGSTTALAAQVVAGAVPLTPLLYTKDILLNQRKGAPIDLAIARPIVPITATLALARNAPHPYGAMLLIDFILSTEEGGGQRITLKQDYGSAALGEGGQRYEVLNMALQKNYDKDRKTWQDLFEKYLVRGGS
ncbi:MAG: extracellular solute-binding protein [Chloroflexi bacterium]|nr:extracellular solute-binding protein [Chloroflexota bacterium]